MIENTSAEDAVKRAALGNIRGQQDMWNRFRRRTWLSSVKDPNGNPCASMKASAGALCDDWGKIWKISRLARPFGKRFRASPTRLSLIHISEPTRPEPI
eukprot:7022128-Pyramimonas_sp.AAC.1